MRSAAIKIINWRNEQRNPTIPHSLLVGEELREALRLRWIVDHEGFRYITNEQAKIEEMDAQAKQLAVGDSVTAAQDGQPFTGVVKYVGPDGVKISWGDKKPRDPEKLYNHNEVNTVAKAAPNIPQGSKPVNPDEDSGRHGMFSLARNVMTR